MVTLGEKHCLYLNGTLGKVMFRIMRIVLVVLVGLGIGSVQAQNWNKKDEVGVKTWKGLIPASYSPNLETVRYHMELYNNRGPKGRYDSEPSPSPRALKFNLRDEPFIDRQLRKTFLASYLMYEKGEVVIDKISPQDRFGDLINNDTYLYSMSLGKSVGSYLMGHAICKGYIESLDHKLSDWPIVENTLIAEASVRDVINAAMGHQKYMRNNEIFSETGTNVNDYDIETLAQMELFGSTPSRKRYEYGQLPANIALNYIDFKTGHQFQSFMNEVFRDHVALDQPLRFTHIRRGFDDMSGRIRANFLATRYDTLRIGIAILDDWHSDNCVGKYLKDIYKNRIKKERGSDTGWGHSKSYGGFFHIDYPYSSDLVMGMEGFGGIGLLINFDDDRIIYGHAAHRNMDSKQIYNKAIDDGRY
jgi:hypothetical protein